jgi:hypothetical protein
LLIENNHLKIKNMYIILLLLDTVVLASLGTARNKAKDAKN